jgi:predicted DNA-binding transcriptional regulator YafY
MHPSQRVEIEPDGTALVHFELSGTLEIRSWILSFGPAAEVLEPESLRQEIREQLAGMLARYEPQASGWGKRDWPTATDGDGDAAP